ncbi:MAG: undecaprenyl-phosphate glucose phosphotransferase [Patescibacteria group bacterium]
MKQSELFFAFVLLPVDILAIVAAFALAYYIRADLEIAPVFAQIGVGEYVKYALYLLPAWLALFTLNGLYSIKATRRHIDEVYRIFNASSTAMLILVMVIFLSRSLFFSRLILVITWGLSIFLVASGRLIVKTAQTRLFALGVGVRNVLLVGDNDSSAEIGDLLSSRRDLGYRICGLINGSSASNKSSLRVLGKLGDMAQIIKKHRIDELVVTDTSLNKDQTINLIQICADNNVAFKYVPDVFALLTSNVIPGRIGTLPVMELMPIPLDGWGRIAKRTFDIIFSLVALIITSPLMLMIAILEKITSRGPIIYSHQRVGRDGRIFMLYKFRSMYQDAEKSGRFWTASNDDRITPLGSFLRKTNLDEIPQFYNVLHGDMSLVGPRPEQPRFVERFQREIPEYFRRHRVKSGLTGWAQVNGYKGDTSIKERVRFDIYYIENWSLWFDFVVLVKTAKLMVVEVLGGKIEYQK